MPVTPAGSSGWAGLFALIGPAVALALASKLVTDFTNQEFKDKGVDSNFKPPGLGVPNSITAGLHNLAEAIRLWQAGAPKPHIPGQFPGKEQDERNIVPKLQDSFDRSVAAPIVAAINSLKGKIEDDRIIPPPLRDSHDRSRPGPFVPPTGPFVPTVKLDASQITDLRPTTAAVDSLKGKISDDLIAVKTGVGSAVETSGAKVVGATQFSGILGAGATAIGAMMTAGAALGAGERVAGAIAAKDMSVDVSTNVTVNVTASNVTKQIVIQKRYGPGNGSRGQDGSGVLHNGAN